MIIRMFPLHSVFYGLNINMMSVLQFCVFDKKGQQLLSSSVDSSERYSSELSRVCTFKDFIC